MKAKGKFTILTIVAITTRYVAEEYESFRK